MSGFSLCCWMNACGTIGAFALVLGLSASAHGDAVSLPVGPLPQELDSIPNLQPDHAPDAIIVMARPGVADAQIREAIDSMNGEIVWRSSLVEGLLEIRLNEPVSLENALFSLLSRGDMFLCAEPDYLGEVHLTPNDAFYGFQWNMENNGQVIDGRIGLPGADSGAHAAWDLATDASDIVVAVIDTGAFYNHPDLVANLWHNPGEIPANNIDDDNNGFIDDVHGYDFVRESAATIDLPADNPLHSTHVAGVIGAVGNNSIGVAGVAWNTQLMYVKIANAAGQIAITDAIQGLEYAVANGAHISNHSWGTLTPSLALENAVAATQQHDHLIVASSGNDSVPQADWPGAYPFDNIITVTALNNQDGMPSFAQYSATAVDVGAPGVNVLSTVPFVNNPNGYGQLSGTSFASPLVAGAAALLRQIRPDWTPSEVRRRILETARPVASLEGRTVTGGSIDVAAAVSPPVFLAPRLDITNRPAEFIEPCASATFSASLDSGEDVITAGPSVIYRKNGGVWTTLDLDAIGNAAISEPILCGDVVEYYFSVTGQNAGSVTVPPNTSAETFAFRVASPQVVFADTFVEDRGWVVNRDATDTATAGIWERTIPAITAAQPAGGSDDDFAFFTDGRNGPLTSVGAYDVDGGRTTLTSPLIDLTNAIDVVVSYDRWYLNNLGTVPNEDIFVVEVTNDDGQSWTVVETVGPTGTGTAGSWISASFVLDEFVTPTADVRFRFVAEDIGGGSIVEAGLDNVRVAANVCTDPDHPADWNNDQRIDSEDVNQFLGDLDGELPSADLDQNGIVDVFDLIEYLDRFDQPCGG